MKEVKNENENGRSMIEMLGVLAIIGVLSVGGIAGYSKAMYRYRLNKTIEQITYSAGAVRSFFAPQKSYEGLGECFINNVKNCAIYRKAKLVSDDMFGDYLNDSGQTMSGGVANPFGGQFMIGAITKIRNGACTNNPICNQQAFYISLSYLPQEACIDLITQDWSSAGVSMIKVYNYEHPISALREAYIIPPVSFDHAVKICKMRANDANGVWVSFYFDADVTQGGHKTRIDNTRTTLDAL